MRLPVRPSSESGSPPLAPWGSSHTGWSVLPCTPSQPVHMLTSSGKARFLRGRGLSK
ncbi:hypothetical protein CALVIDRAFT_536998 [Calocera viscosa TUFC12733]|uniref:Uncharacterized protein n=1 Tax=Calocera viscosa (strain TUFC12733) TaxID=1330018 RepID=A0A167MEI0_CALVF|nr:hypothetical protein CALVIDRAFT_536998 [Calocera viscosa TUFC12733]